MRCADSFPGARCATPHSSSRSWESAEFERPLTDERATGATADVRGRPVGWRPVTASERHFRAMGSDVHLIVVGGPDELAERARDRIDDLEHKWSRFLR